MVAQLLPLAIGLPLLGAGVLGLGGLWFPGLRSQRNLFGTVATGIVLASFAIFLLTFLNYTAPLQVQAWDWIVIEPMRLSLRFEIDTLSLWMALVVTGIGALIHLYSIGYMAEEAGSWRYFAFLNLFIFSMLVLVLADSLPLLFLGWEGVGACSYFLIGYWFSEEANARAAQKAFIMNRIGDLGLLMGMIWLYAETGTFDIALLKGYIFPADTATGIALLLFLAATGKSAQIPLYTWLPDAMAGPTPVSALIHAATMVTAGVYLVARMDFLFTSTPETLLLVSGIGTATALLAGLIATRQYDIKKILAYSTVSQLGFMFAAAGAGAYMTAIFHVFTHAFFKALLFLGSGSVIHATGTQDIREMGGLRRIMPITGWTFWIGTLAIAGIPPLSGFFSKDEILAALYARGSAGETLYFIFWATLLLVAFLTAFYMGRLTWLTFEGEYRGKGTPHESPTVMTLPLIILGVGSVLVGLLGLPPLIGTSWLREHWLIQSIKEPSLPLLSHTSEAVLLIISVIIATAGLGAAWLLFGRESLSADERLSNQLGSFHELLNAQLRIDRLYEKIFLQPYYVIADFAKDVWTTWIGRGAPQLIAMVFETAGRLFTRMQVGYLPAYVLYLAVAGLLMIVWVLWL
ncbi:MAG: NADH-quinone oxidoreductase subunit L [Bacteroidia bacterium]|nr:NADH-quinone oxidoreductase subunit L [Bacteroidia bacterium]MCX7651262.1 NADH-quinone oxidoreductase subunit L [Bacteroidia bacterium]MDW8416210.1 NADH-quinone oxidoreductase subunit L [Bacteroidia bacterium]